MRFETKNIELFFGGQAIRLTIIENLDALFDALIAKGDTHPDVVDERIPYWAELWASALGMAQYLAENPALVAGQSVFEIGCGLGLPSILAGKLGASQVTLSDYLPEALDFAHLNWAQNFPNTETLDISAKGQVSRHPKVQFLELDWRHIPDIAAADILIASDVAYEARAFPYLLAAFKKLVKPSGKILIAEPNRPVSKQFFARLDTAGYHIKTTTLSIERKGHVFTVNVFELAQQV
jgi:predicted nicotinamide N-methyase